MFEIIDKITQCPFCEKDAVILDHDYSKTNTSANLLVRCNECGKILDRQALFGMTDAVYAYSETIKSLLDDYCKNNNDEILEKFYDELEKVEVFCFL